MKAKGDWVQIEAVMLTPEQRPGSLPASTRACSYIMRCNGYLMADAAEGQDCQIRTLAGRHVKGRLLAAEPAYGHSYGRVIKELLDVRGELQCLMRRDASHV